MAGYEPSSTGDAGGGHGNAASGHADLSGAELSWRATTAAGATTCQELVGAMAPESAVVSVGYNSYGHPTAEALRRAASFGAALYRTDLNGNVTICIVKKPWLRQKAPARTTAPPSAN
jgi:competence protein ComEC